MEKINHFNKIENLIYDHPIGRQIRFVNIVSHHNDSIFYYDCLFADVVLLKRAKVLQWKDGTLSSGDFPFSNQNYVKSKEQPAFQKNCWATAVNQSKEMIDLLNKYMIDKGLSSELFNDIEKIIQKIQSFFDLKTQKNLTFHLENNIYDKLESPKLFNQLVFTDKHKNSIYLLLEKIFHSFEIFSKYQINEIYPEVKNIDSYLVNHIQNIYFSNHFPMINIEKETISILNKINNYLTQKIDKHLEECIEKQLFIMDSIQSKFNRVNQI